MPSKAALIEELERLRAENEFLSRDRAYGGLTRPGVEIEHRKRAQECQYVVYLDLNKVHTLNHLHGESQVDRMIRGAFEFHIRERDLVVFGRWKSGDEIVFLISGDPDGFTGRLHENLDQNGLSGISAYAQIIDQDLVGAVDKASEDVRAAKNARSVESR